MRRSHLSRFQLCGLRNIAAGRVFVNSDGKGHGMRERTFRSLSRRGLIAVQWADAPSGYHVAPRVPVALTVKGEKALVEAGQRL